MLTGGKAFERIREFGNNRNMPISKTISNKKFRIKFLKMVFIISQLLEEQHFFYEEQIVNFTVFTTTFLFFKMATNLRSFVKFK